MDITFLLLAINTMANLQNLELNKNKLHQEATIKKLDDIIELLKRMVN